jgi:hypothetical protein
MRRWQPPNPSKDLADIMVSELLGSFGDNELSPECLDGAQVRVCTLWKHLKTTRGCTLRSYFIFVMIHQFLSYFAHWRGQSSHPYIYNYIPLSFHQRFLRPGTGVSIPVDYTSYLSPVAAAKLWNEAKHSKTIETPLKVLVRMSVV